VHAASTRESGSGIRGAGGGWKERGKEKVCGGGGGGWVGRLSGAALSRRTLKEQIEGIVRAHVDAVM
jgi:hypothetical protein